MLAITEIKVSELICRKFVPAKHGKNKGELILLRETVLKEEGGTRENSFFPPTEKINGTNNNNNELYLHDQISTYSIAKAVE